ARTRRGCERREDRRRRWWRLSPARVRAGAPGGRPRRAGGRRRPVRLVRVRRGGSSRDARRRAVGPAPRMSSRPFVLVDRDGTINVEHAGGYVLEPDDFELLPGSLEGLRTLRDLGLPIAVVTNQS